MLNTSAKLLKTLHLEGLWLPTAKIDISQHKLVCQMYIWDNYLCNHYSFHWRVHPITVYQELPSLSMFWGQYSISFLNASVHFRSRTEIIHRNSTHFFFVLTTTLAYIRLLGKNTDMILELFQILDLVKLFTKNFIIQLRRVQLVISHQFSYHSMSKGAFGNTRSENCRHKPVVSLIWSA